MAGYIPWQILRARHELALPVLSISAMAAASVALVGIGVLLICVWDFFQAGRGTLAPFDPPTQLVVRGLYRFTRNPMYNGVTGLLLGEAWFFQSSALFQYALVIFVMFHLMVVIYEEPALESKFGENYRAYRAVVPRWGFTVRAFADQEGD